MLTTRFFFLSVYIEVREEWVNPAFFFMEVSLLSQESERSCICMRVSILTLSAILILILEMSNSSLSNIASRENDIGRKYNA